MLTSNFPLTAEVGGGSAGVILLILVIMAMIGVGIYFYLKDQKTKTN